MRSITEALILLSDYKIVHSDLKPDNILMELNKSADDFDKLKLIDFGSAYSFEEAGSISMATPEYMPPEVLELILNSNKYTGPHKSQIEALSEVSQPWSVDVWSLASIVLEILIGIPHWISYKCKITGKKGKEILKTGLFAVKGRTYDKIIAKQKNLIENLEAKLEECLDVQDPNNQKLCDLLIKMFEWNPKKRISPEEIVKHPFLNINI
jgi:dual specificity tyrosine-phosphorylation-regulated kinase 2/3/4